MNRIFPWYPFGIWLISLLSKNKSSSQSSSLRSLQERQPSSALIMRAK
jgi:hypothetical protein